MLQTSSLSLVIVNRTSTKQLRLVPEYVKQKSLYCEMSGANERHVIRAESKFVALGV